MGKGQVEWYDLHILDVVVSVAAFFAVETHVWLGHAPGLVAELIASTLLHLKSNKI